MRPCGDAVSNWVAEFGGPKTRAYFSWPKILWEKFFPQETKRASVSGWLSVRVIGGNQQQRGAWMNSKRAGRYFQFPIRALRVGCRLDAVTREQAGQVFSNAIDYSITGLATELQNDERLDVLADAYLAGHDAKDSEDEAVRAVAAACEVLGVNAPNLRKAKVKAFADSWKRIESVPGSNLLVRVRADLMWEFRDSWAFRDAAILCGVYAGVGDAAYKRLDCNRIRTLAMGFASAAELQKYGARLPMLSDRQVRHTLSQLERRKFFQRATPDGRHTYYSHRLNEQEMCGALAQLVVKRKRRETDRKRAAILAQAEQLMAAEAAAALNNGGR
jgi:hypothetical protein